MTEISSVDPFSLNRQGVVQTDKEAGAVLGQEDFLKLLTAQLTNQDPMSPMDNAEFLSQMAQFSTVDGIERVNSGIEGLANTMSQSQVQTAASLLGKSVLVDGNVARPGSDGGIHGMATLDSAASEVVVSYNDATTGGVLYTQVLGAQSPGQVAFDWDNVPEDIVANHGQVRVTVVADTETGTVSVPTSVYAQVKSAIGGPSSTNITLQLEDYGALDTLEVTAFR